MGTVATSSLAQATAFGNQRHLDRCQNGVLWAMRQGEANLFNFSYSTDSGASWAESNSFGGGSGFSPNGSFFIDLDDYAHTVVKDPSNGYLYYRRGTPNAARTSYTWSAATTVRGDAAGDLPDIVAFRDPTTSGAWVAHVVFSVISGSTCYVGYNRLNINAGGTVTAAGDTLISAGYSPAAATYPSIDFRHTGDAKTVAAGTPDLYVGWSAGGAGSGKGIRFRKASYSGGSWSWGTEREIDNTGYISGADKWLNCCFDGTRVVLTGYVDTASTNNALVAHERDAADTTPTSRTLLSNLSTANQLAYGSSTYDAAGNLYFFGRDGTGSAGTRKVNSRRWVRTTATLDALSTFDASGNDTPYISARRGPSGSAIDYVYTDGTASPYTVTSGRITLNQAPNAGGKPTPDGANLDRTVAQSFSYAFSDPDAGDQPSKTDWRWRTSPVSGTPGAWNTSTVTGNSTSITYPANAFPAGRIELQVLPYDSQGVVAPAWSESAFDTAANPPTAPTFSAPAAGSTIATSSVTATIVADTLDAHQWRVMGDTSGSANTTVVNAGATIEDPTSRTFTVTGLANAQTVHLQDRRRVGGIWSPWADNGAQAVSYTPPPPATIVLTPLPATAKLSVAWTIPTPTGSEPAVSTVDVYVDDGTAEGLRRIAGTGAVDRAPGASPWVHDTPALLREYGNGTGRVVVVVKGANGTTRTTAS